MDLILLYKWNMDIQDEQDKNRRSSSVTFSFIGGAPQAHGVSYAKMGHGYSG
jgi:hypothetical protein